MPLLELAAVSVYLLFSLRKHVLVSAYFMDTNFE